MSGGVDIHRYGDAQQLAVALAQVLARQLRDAIAARAVASLVVSGGRTPLPLFGQLRREALDWSRVFVTLADERWVDAEDVASNERLVREELLRDAAVAARFIPLKTPAESPAAGLREAWQRLAQIPRPFDIVLLGMGDDGHTASLFPLSPGIDAAMDPAAQPGLVATTAPVAPTRRISMNLATLVQSRQHYLHFTGAAKWQLWQSSGAELPVGLTLRRAVSRPQLYWSP